MIDIQVYRDLVYLNERLQMFHTQKIRIYFNQEMLGETGWFVTDD